MGLINVIIKKVTDGPHKFYLLISLSVCQSVPVCVWRIDSVSESGRWVSKMLLLISLSRIVSIPVPVCVWRIMGGGGDEFKRGVGGGQCLTCCTTKMPLLSKASICFITTNPTTTNRRVPLHTHAAWTWGLLNPMTLVER